MKTKPDQTKPKVAGQIGNYDPWLGSTCARHILHRSGWESTRQGSSKMKSNFYWPLIIDNHTRVGSTFFGRRSVIGLAKFTAHHIVCWRRRWWPAVCVVIDNSARRFRRNWPKQKSGDKLFKLRRVGEWKFTSSLQRPSRLPDPKGSTLMGHSMRFTVWGL